MNKAAGRPRRRALSRLSPDGNDPVPASHQWPFAGGIRICLRGRDSPHPKSGIDKPLGGSVSLAGGNFQSGQAGYTLAGGLGSGLGFFLAYSLTGSGQRYLDPVDPGNFNNRLFMPPQIENLLLSSSEQARRLSPFATPEGIGGARVPPEKQHAFEVGFGQPFGDWFQLNTACWWRLVRNYADPNVFLSTTVIFPNSVARGKAQGLEAHIDFPQRKGWSGYLSYSNSRVFQVGPINGELSDAVILTPGRKAAGGIQLGPAGVGIVVLRGEKLQHALGRLGSRREKGRGLQFCAGGEVHHHFASGGA